MWRRYVLTFLIFVLGFEIGVAGKLLLDRMTLSEDERIELLETVKQYETPGPNVNKDGPLLIEYSGTEPMMYDKSVAYFKVINFGREDIFFSSDGAEGKNLCRLHEGLMPGTFSVGSSFCHVPVTVLKPTDKTFIEVPVEESDIAYYLTWTYFVGDDRAEQRTSMVVRDIR